MADSGRLITPGPERQASRPIIVYSRAHVLAAAAMAAKSNRAVTLRSPPGAAAYMGAAYFQAMIAEASAAWPTVEITAVLDCGDLPGLALGALRRGVKRIRFTGTGKIRAKIADIAQSVGAILDQDRRKALDLIDVADPEAACREWINGGKHRN